MAELILTEKFSVASDFAKALGVSKKGDGCFRNEDTIITWAVGHLVELYEPEDYDDNLKKWRMETLPLIPEKFRYKPIRKTYQQFKIIRSLMRSKEVERVIIATDAGREGEVIARTILLESGFTDKERIFRFWTSQALVPDVVRRSMSELKPISHYDRLWRAGYYRQVADWLVGMNLTRMVTLRVHGDLFSVGRVQTAVLALIVDRKLQRDRFVPETYWIIKVLFSNEKGRWIGYWFRAGAGGAGAESAAKEKVDGNPGAGHTLKQRDEMERLCKKLGQASSGSVQSVIKEKKKEPPPLLFSLTDLQQEANRKFGFSAQKTLTIAQSLYQDRKCLSYPRTDSRVVGTQNLELVQNIIGKMEAAYPDIFKGVQPAKISLANRRVFNDARLTDHHALIPFKPAPQGATGDELSLFNLVTTRFAAAFYPDCEFENTSVVTELAEETFQTRGRVILVSGWRSIYREQEPQSQGSGVKKSAKERRSLSESEGGADNSLDREVVEHIPPLVKGDSATAEKITPEEKQTTPPPDYTDSLLLKDMTNPGRYVEEEQIKKVYRGDIGIGTQATRAQIIETLITRKYIERSGRKLIPTEKGLFLVEILRRCPITSVLTSPEETARWEMSLNLIALGENSVAASGESDDKALEQSASRKSSASIHPTAFLTRIKSFVISAVNELKLAKLEVRNFNLDTPASAVIGRCPACGQPVRENRKGFSCADRGCKFVIWKKIAGKIISPAMASNLITFKKSGPFKGFLSREKKSFSASLLLHQQDGEWKVSFDFNSSMPERENPSAKLPLTGRSGLSSEGRGSESEISSSESARPLCPLCGGEIIEGKRGYGCANWRAEDGNCRFVIWKEIMGRRLTEKNISTLAAGKQTSSYVLKDQHGNKFKAKLRMVPQESRASNGRLHSDGASDPDSVMDLHGSRIYAIEVVPEKSDAVVAEQRYIICSR